MLISFSPILLSKRLLSSILPSILPNTPTTLHYTSISSILNILYYQPISHHYTIYNPIPTHYTPAHPQCISNTPVLPPAGPSGRQFHKVASCSIIQIYFSHNDSATCAPPSSVIRKYRCCNTVIIRKI
jgi:hypothetical protein